MAEQKETKLNRNTYLPIPGLDGYSVTRKGVVIKDPYTIIVNHSDGRQTQRHYPLKELSVRLNSAGTPCVSITKPDRKQTLRTVPHLVVAAYLYRKAETDKQREMARGIIEHPRRYQAYYLKELYNKDNEFNLSINNVKLMRKRQSHVQLSDQDVREIRKLLQSPSRNVRNIADRYNVSPSTIYAIGNRTRRGDVE